MPTFIGENFAARNDAGELKVRIATVFPHSGTIVTRPSTHFEQRLEYVGAENLARQQQGKPPFTEAEYNQEIERAVDLLADENAVLIRPDPSRMDLAFDADELLQELMPKRRIKYMFLSDRRVRESLKRRGECWRMFQPPTAPDQIRRMIAESRSGIEGRPIYFYSPTTGMRLLTYGNLAKLGKLDDAELRKHLIEIATYAGRRNLRRYHEVEFFMVGAGFDGSEFEAFRTCPEEELRPRYAKLCEHYRNAVPLEFQEDCLDDAAWRKAMFGVLNARPDDVLLGDQTSGLDPDFSMRVEWLPGGRIEQGELILDAAMEESQASNIVRGLILNLVQEYGNLEYINLGSVLPSPDRDHRPTGRREVYVAQIKQRRSVREVLQILRMLRWGVRERLDQGNNLERAMLDTEEYEEYVFDRRLACQQLAMNLQDRQTTRKVSEIYRGSNTRYVGCRIWSPYLQRDYIPGIGTDQLPARKLGDDNYATIFSRLMGEAAASNLILGRAELTGPIMFDAGDEILVEDAAGMPVEIVVSDHAGTFVDWNGSLETRAPEYAAPIVQRISAVSDRAGFIEAYLSGFADRFTRVQEECLKHRRAFDTLFKHRPFDPAGSLSCRWSRVLERLRNARAGRLAEMIQAAIPESSRIVAVGVSAAV
jgi:hypothetical protein